MHEFLTGVELQVGEPSTSASSTIFSSVSVSDELFNNDDRKCSNSSNAVSFGNTRKKGREFKPGLN